MNRTASAAMVLALFGACGSSSDADPDAAALGDAGPLLEQPDGLVSVEPFLESSVITLAGAFHDGARLEARVEMARLGACRLMKYTPTFCEPACTNSEQCIEGACQPFPTRLDKGSIDWSWQGGQRAVAPDGTTFYSAQGAAAVHGETSLTVAGETLRVVTIEAPDPANDWAQVIESRSGNATLRWSNPLAGARVRLSMTDCVGSHGGIGESEIECEAADSGELVIPDSFLTALEAGNWGRGECGSHGVVRSVFADAADESFRFEARSATAFFYFPRD